MLPFRPGVERILRDAPEGTPIIPVQLDRVWGSIFSFEGGRFGWKWPRRVPYPVTVSIGKPLPASASVFQIRQTIQELGAEKLLEMLLSRLPPERIQELLRRREQQG